MPFCLTFGSTFLSFLSFLSLKAILSVSLRHSLSLSVGYQMGKYTPVVVTLWYRAPGLFSGLLVFLLRISFLFLFPSLCTGSC
jgi:hypothetical protein